MSSLPDSSLMSDESETELEEASEVTTTTRNRNKARKVTATDTWEHTREPKDGEPKKRNGALVLYCKHCEDYGVTGTTSFRYHLKSKHAILVEPKERQVTTTSNQKFAEKFGISEEELRREVLKSVLDKRAINEALMISQ
jgi:hypothetical protein